MVRIHYPTMIKQAQIQLVSALAFFVLLTPAFAASGDTIDPSTLPSCDQEMTTCPCNGVRVDKDLIHSGDVLMIRLEGTSVISFPLKVQ